MFKVRKRLRAARSEPYVRLGGCPVSVAEQTLAISMLGHTTNPFFVPKQALLFNKGYLASKAALAAKRIVGTPYQVNGTTRERGEAAPVVDRPTAVVGGE